MKVKKLFSLTPNIARLIDQLAVSEKRSRSAIIELSVIALANLLKKSKRKP